MSRTVRRALAAIAAAALGLLAGQLWLARDAGDAAAAPSDAVDVTTSIQPDVHLFGATVNAVVEVRVNTAVIDLSTVRPEIDFTPYDLAGDRRATRGGAGDLAVLRFVYPIRCLKEGCDATGNRGLVELPTSRVAYRFRESGGQSFAPIDWPVFEVAGRVTDEDVQQIRWRAAETSLPTLSSRLTGGRWALLGLALVAACLAGVLAVARTVWGTAAAGAAEDDGGAVELSPLARAAAALRTLAPRGDAAQTRRALERLAVESAAAGRIELAASARELAWSPGGPAAADAEELASAALDGAA